MCEQDISAHLSIAEATGTADGLPRQQHDDCIRVGLKILPVVAIATVPMPLCDTILLVCRKRIAVQAAFLMLTIATATAQTSLPVKAIGPTLVEIKVGLKDTVACLFAVSLTLLFRLHVGVSSG